MMYIKAQYPAFPNEGIVTLFIPVEVEGGETWLLEVVRTNGVVSNMKVHQLPLPDDVVELSGDDPFTAELPKLAEMIVPGTLAKRDFITIFQALTIVSYNPDADHGQQVTLN